MEVKSVETVTRFLWCSGRLRKVTFSRQLTTNITSKKSAAPLFLAPFSHRLSLSQTHEASPHITNTPPLSDCHTPATLQSICGEWGITLKTHALLCPLTQAYFKRYVVRRQFLQHVVSQPGHHGLSGFPSAQWAVFRLNIEDGVQDVLSQLTLVGDVGVRVETEHLWSVVGRQTLWKRSSNRYWTRGSFGSQFGKIFRERNRERSSHRSADLVTETFSDVLNRVYVLPLFLTSVSKTYFPCTALQFGRLLSHCCPGSIVHSQVSPLIHTVSPTASFSPSSEELPCATHARFIIFLPVQLRTHLTHK